MMIECPRCGFVQPKDQFCASCGLNIDHYVSRPKPWLIRLLQNPNFHLSLIGALIVVVIGYIFYSQSEMVARRVNELLDVPLSSREAGDPSESESTSEMAKKSAASTAQPTSVQTQIQPVGETEIARAADANVPASAEPTADGPVAKLTDRNKIEITHWEIPREALANLVSLAEKVVEGQAGRSYLFNSGSKVFDQVQSSGQRLGLGRILGMRVGSQLNVDTPSSTTEAFQYSLAVQVTRLDAKEVAMKWDAQVVLPQPETPGEIASGAPSVRQTVMNSINGTVAMNSGSLFMILIEPNNRSPREELVLRAGDGPWSIFGSEEFRRGLTEWIVTAQVK